MSGELSDLPEQAEPAGRDEPCTIDETLNGDVLGLRLPTWEGIDVLLRLAFDAQQEALVGRWGADVAIDISGPVQLKRLAWLPLRNAESFGDRTFLGCLERPLPQCADGQDNDGDGLVDGEDPACCTSNDCLLLKNDESADPPCSDGVDNDGDGRIDADDPECQEFRWSAETGRKPICADGRDNDGDGRIDLEDPDCKGDPTHWSEVALMCQDGLDNDGDKKIDADDPDCQHTDKEDPTAPECTNGYDDDGNGLTDLANPACHDNPCDGQESSVDQCDDGIDNDGDRLTDLQEPGCTKSYVTSEDGTFIGLTGQECTDGLDNDQDGLTDEDDPQCIWYGIGDELTPTTTSLSPFFQSGTCDDGVDNDGDGLIDEADPGCAVSTPLLYERIAAARFEGLPPCIDAIDNDGDGLTDMADPDCTDPFAVSERPGCDNGFDDDGDDLTDRADPACLGGAAGPELRPQCADGEDNDGDGLIDADDPHCRADATPLFGVLVGLCYLSAPHPGPRAGGQAPQPPLPEAGGADALRHDHPARLGPGLELRRPQEFSRGQDRLGRPSPRRGPPHPPRARRGAALRPPGGGYRRLGAGGGLHLWLGGQPGLSAQRAGSSGLRAHQQNHHWQAGRQRHRLHRLHHRPHKRGGQRTLSDPLVVEFFEVKQPELKVNTYRVGDSNDFVFSKETPARVEVEATVEAWANGQKAPERIAWSITQGMLSFTEERLENGRRVRFKAHGLPASNDDLGKKELRATFRDTSCPCESQPRQVRLFFPRDAKNNPDGKWPNWAYYWKQTRAGGAIDFKWVEVIPPDGTVSQDPSREMARYNGFNDTIYITSMIFKPGCSIRPDGQFARGIDCFGAVVRHENQHRKDDLEWWGPRLARWSRVDDPDGDFVPTSWEKANGCDPLNPFSCPGRPQHFSKEVRDTEVHAYWAGYTWTIGDGDDEDWADPGKQCGQ